MRQIRAFKTPNSLETGDITLCRPLFIPLPMLHLVGGALALLTEPANWEQEGTMTPLEASSTMTAMLTAWANGECDMGCCLERTNPNTGVRQFSSDGGETWTDIQEVPLLPYDAAVSRRNPPPRGEATEDDRICVAATNAAFILRQTHISISETLGTEYTNMLDEAAELGEDIFVLFTTLGIAEFQPVVGLTALFVLIGIAVQFNTNPLTDDDEQRLLCILQENATDTDGVVTFDFNGVWGAIDLDDPKQTNVREMLTALGATALNFMGAQSILPAGDCGCEVGCAYVDGLETGLGPLTHIAAWTGTTYAPSWGVYSATGGRTGGGCLKPQGDGVHNSLNIVIDLGEDCPVSGFSYWYQELVGTGAFMERAINYYQADGTWAGQQGFVRDYQFAWTQYTVGGPVVPVRYIYMYSYDDGSAVYALDDLEVISP